MNSAAAALVSAAALAALLAVHSAAVGSEVRIAGEAADMIASLAASSNEAVSASYDEASRSIEVLNHGPSAVRLFMADIAVEAAPGAEPVRVRVVLAPERYAAPQGMAVSNGTAVPLHPARAEGQGQGQGQGPAHREAAAGSGRGGARELAPGAAASIPLAGALEAAADAAGAAGGRAAAAPRLAAAAVATDAGSRFAVAVPPPPPPAAARPGGAAPGPGGGGAWPGNGTGNGTATIAGMGIGSRMLHAWHGGFAVEGNGTAGRILPVSPYIATDGTADDFVGVVIAGDRSERLAVESLSGSYEYGPGGSLLRGPEGRPAPLAYAAKRTLEGSPSVERDASGLHLRGPGRVVLELHGGGGGGGAGGVLFLSGAARGGAELFVGVSPYDLISRAYAAGLGFEVWRGQAAGPSVLRLDASCSPPPGRNEFAASYEWDVPSVPVGARGRVSHAAEASANNNLPDPGTGSRGSPLMPAAARVSYGSGGGMYSTVESLHMQSGSAPQLNGRTDCRMRPAAVLPVLYDEVPMAELLGGALPSGGAGGGGFEAAIAAPGGGGAVYVLAHLDGSSAAADLSARLLSPGEPLLRLGGLPPSVPYRLAAGGATAAAGVTSAAGGADLTAADLGVGGAAHTAESHCSHECPGGGGGGGAGGGAAPAAPGAVLHLYRDSFAVRGHVDSAVAYDPIGGAAFEVPRWRADTVYVVHAWARIPVAGQVDVSGAALNGTLRLPHLDGKAGRAEAGAAPGHLHVPVVPGYSYVSMSVDSVPAALAFADAAAAGGAGGAVRVLPAARADAAAASPDGPVLSASASAGASSAHIAPRDGRLGAVFAMQVSGSARIDNVHAVAAGAAPGLAAPAAPPGWSAGRLVSPHVVVRINGEEAGVVPLGAGPAAAWAGGGRGGGGAGAGAGEYSSSAGAGSVLESVAYRPFVHDVRGSASFPVRAGDLVEFDVRAAAEARAPPPYSPPAGVSIARSTGSAHVLVAVESGSVIAGM